MDLAKYFNENMVEVQRIADVHKHYYERDVVISNLYLYLSDKTEELTENNVMGYIVQWCSMLKHWTNNRCTFLMEERKAQERHIELHDVYKGSEYPLENLDFDKTFKDYLGTLDSYMDRCIIRDYYEVTTIVTIDDIMDFYKVRRRQAFEIRKKIGKLEKGLYEYLKKGII